MELLLKQLHAILQNPELLGSLTNSAALLYHSFDNLNWLGFYFYKDNALVLGPFQGKIACERIDLNKGVCGKAFSSRKVQNIKNVHEFPGHIACDSASNSELVIPLIAKDKIYGVLDIDSPIYERFDENLERFFTQAAKLIAEKISNYNMI